MPGTISADDLNLLTASGDRVMFGYVKDLRSTSQGRATFTMQFDHYAETPPSLTGDDPPFRPAIGMRLTRRAIGAGFPACQGGFTTRSQGRRLTSLSR
jgi:hypothetical protein